MKIPLEIGVGHQARLKMQYPRISIDSHYARFMLMQYILSRIIRSTKLSGLHGTRLMQIATCEL